MKWLYVYRNGRDTRISAKTGSWEKAEQKTREMFDSFDHAKQLQRRLEAKLNARNGQVEIAFAAQQFLQELGRKPQIPCILPSDASTILERCEQILEGSRELLTNLRNVGIAELFARLDDSVLQLAIQPDSWGERARARLMSHLAPALCATLSPGSALNIDDIVRVTNAVTPCLVGTWVPQRPHPSLSSQGIRRSSMLVFACRSLQPRCAR